MRRHLALFVALVLVVAACAGVVSGPNNAPSAAETATDPAADAAADNAVDAATALPALPEREGPRRQTSGSVPHVQLDAEPVPAVDAELRRRAFLLPGIEERASAISLPGARALWLSDDTPVVQRGVMMSRELAHIHPDGSLHVWLPVSRAAEVDQMKWGELHPWVSRDGFWDGVTMIYTPETPDELDVTIRLLVDAYNFITGSNLDPADLD